MNRKQMNDLRFRTSIAELCLDWVIFPLLLFLQFGAAMYCQGRDFGAGLLDWGMVYFTILVFCLMSGVYRQIIRLHSCQYVLLLLLPEIFTNLVLGSVILYTVVQAYMLLVILTFILFFVATIVAIHLSLTNNTNDTEKKLSSSSSSSSADDYHLLSSIDEEYEDDSDTINDSSIC